MKKVPVRFELDKEYLAGIGAICFHWSLVERALAEITFGLLWLDHKRGRVAVRSPRATDQISMIQQLMGLEDLKAIRIDMSALSTSLGKLERMRDLAAHGIWLKGDNGEVLLQDLGGNWKPDPKGPKVARRIKPEAVPMRAEDLMEVAKLVQTVHVAILTLAEDLSKQRIALRGKSPPRSPLASPPDDSSLGSKPPPPEASRG